MMSRKKKVKVGDILISEYGYAVVVRRKRGDLYGQLICPDSDSCAKIPYALNEGRGYTKLKKY